MKAVHEISRRSVKVFAWNASAASYTMYPWGPRHFGGRGDLRPRILQEHSCTGESVTTIADKVQLPPSSSITFTLLIDPPGCN